MSLIDILWLEHGIEERHPTQFDSRTSKPWFIDKLTDKPVPFEEMLYEDKTQFFALTGFWSIWCNNIEDKAPIVWRSRPAMIQSKNEDGMPIWRIEAKYGVGEEQ